MSLGIDDPLEVPLVGDMREEIVRRGGLRLGFIRASPPLMCAYGSREFY